MDGVYKYIQTDLIVLIPALWGVGMAIKKSDIQNKYIPIILFSISVIVSALKVYSVCDIYSLKQVCDSAFARITQGSIVFFCAWYGYESHLKSDDKTENITTQIDNIQLKNLMDYDGTLRGQDINDN